MIEINNVEVFNLEGAIRGMRNPMNSWDKSDTIRELGPYGSPPIKLGEKDIELAQKLIKSGTDHSKFMRQIFVTMDIIAPLYWWKEMDTYKVGTVSNSTSTMHKIHERDLTIKDFSVEHLGFIGIPVMNHIIEKLNYWRLAYNDWEKMPPILTKEYTKEDCWYNMIQLLPESYNQKRTWTADYAVLRNIYFARKNHKLNEWKEFCQNIETLPYGKELICCE